jgi:hypothetical protein
MARSYKKSKIFGIAGRNPGVQKTFRSKENRAKRRLVAMKLSSEDYDMLPDEKEYGNEWASPRDGLCYWENAEDEDMRK